MAELPILSLPLREEFERIINVQASDIPITNLIIIGHKRGLVEKGGKAYRIIERYDAAPMFGIGLADEYQPTGREAKIETGDIIEKRLSELTDEECRHQGLTPELAEKHLNRKFSSEEVASFKDQDCLMQAAMGSFMGLMYSGQPVNWDEKITVINYSDPVMIKGKLTVVEAEQLRRNKSAQSASLPLM